MTNTATAQFKNKRVLIMGLGKFPHGSGSAAARFFVSAGAKVTVTDLKAKEELAASVKRLKGLPIKYVLGKHDEKDFKKAEIVMRNPDVRSNNPYLEVARKNGAAVLTDAALFFMVAPPTYVIGVTGTRGKSTTTTLLGEMLKGRGVHVYLGGNIQVSPLTFVDDLWKAYAKLERTAVVLELSSWLLEGFAAAGIAPHTAVVTNILRDHLNTYPSMREYIQAKSEIFRAQPAGGIAVLNRDNETTRLLGKEVPGTRSWFSLKPFAEENGAFIKNGEIWYRDSGAEEKVANVSDVKYLEGKHNLANALAATVAAKVYGVANASIRHALRSFKGLSSRLEFIRSVGGVSYYNDTTATTPDGAIAALTTLAEKFGKKKIVLIAGGKDKELLFGEFAKAIKKYTKAVVLFDGTATAKLADALDQVKYPIETVPIVKDMRLALTLARESAKRGDVVLLSPGAASFGLFQNEFDRGDQFVAAVKKVK